MTTPSYLRRLLLAIAGLAALGSASASPITYGFAGTVQSDEAARGYLSFSGQFSYESGTADSIADPSTGAFTHGSGYAMSLTFDGGFTLTLNGSLSILTTNNLGGADQLGVLAQLGGDIFSLTLWDFTQAVLSSDALPAPALSLNDFGWSTLSWQGSEGELQGTLTGLSCVAGCEVAPPPPPPPPPNAVPEPRTDGLLLAGLALAAVRIGRPRVGRRSGRALP